VERSEVEFGFQGKMIELGLPFEPLQFDEATQGGNEMIGLGGDGLRGGRGRRGALSCPGFNQRHPFRHAYSSLQGQL
jgi:hypothetical protein